MSWYHAKTVMSNGKQFTFTREMLTAIACDQRWPDVVSARFSKFAFGLLCYITSHLSPVHTNPFSSENGAVLLRVRLSSIQQRRKRSGAIWKFCFLKALFSSVDGENDAIWKRWRHQNRHDRAPGHSAVSIQNSGQTLPCGFSLDRRCSMDERKR